VASLSDLFGVDFGEKRPPSPKWASVGDKHDAFISGEPYSEPQVEVNGSWLPLYIEKQGDGKWKVKKEDELTEGSERSALKQIVIPVTLLTGEEATFYVDNKTKKAALKAAMQESGLDLTVGTGIRVERTANVGKLFGWSIKLAAPKVEG